MLAYLISFVSSSEVPTSICAALCSEGETCYSSNAGTYPAGCTCVDASETAVITCPSFSIGPTTSPFIVLGLRFIIDVCQAAPELALYFSESGSPYSLFHQFDWQDGSEVVPIPNSAISIGGVPLSGGAVVDIKGQLDKTSITMGITGCVMGQTCGTKCAGPPHERASERRHRALHAVHHSETHQPMWCASHVSQATK
jgi:hypothetical protein